MREKREKKERVYGYSLSQNLMSVGGESD